MKIVYNTNIITREEVIENFNKLIFVKRWADTVIMLQSKEYLKDYELFSKGTFSFVILLEKHKSFSGLTVFNKYNELFNIDKICNIQDLVDLLINKNFEAFYINDTKEFAEYIKNVFKDE